MTHDEKINWMALWAAKHGVALQLNGEVGIGRECVGIVAGGKYPDYQWYDSDLNEVSGNGRVWKPEDAYHKHDCVAVLGRGEPAESQLYDWLKWFDDNGFTVETGAKEIPKGESQMMLMLRLAMGDHEYARMVKVAPEDAKQ